MDMKKNQDLIDENIAADEFEWVGQDKDAMNAISRESISFWKDSLRRLKQTKSALVFLTILIIITLCAIFIPMFYPIEQSVQHYDCMNLGMFSSCNEGGFMHIFGTDSLGRDIFIRIWEGGRVSLTIAYSAIAIDCVVGVIYGGIAGYFGGMVDNVMMRIVEIVTGIPYILVVILFMMVMSPGIGTLIIAYAITGWVSMARLVRGQVIQLKEQEFVVASQTMGASTKRIILKHLVPNLLSIIIIQLTLEIPSAIFTEAFLSFIGLGVPIPNSSVGTLANDGIQVFRNYPTQLLIPAFFISITMLSFNLLGDKLRDAFDPKLRR